MGRFSNLFQYSEPTPEPTPEPKVTAPEKVVPVSKSSKKKKFKLD